MRRNILRTLGAALLAGCVALGVPAQAQELGRVVSPVLTIDRDKLYAGTLYGQRVKRELDATSNALAAQTRKIEAQLAQEEKDLTAKRGTIPADEFRTLANDFDKKVQDLRAQRDKAQSDMQSQIEAAQKDFFSRIGPILGQLVREHGAVLIIDRRAVLLTAADVDITDAAIQRIDQVLGDGSSENGSSGDAGTSGSSGDAGGLGLDMGTTSPAAPAAPSDGSAFGSGTGNGTGVDTIPAPDEQGGTATDTTGTGQP